MYFFYFYLMLTSRINTNVFFDFTDFQVRQRPRESGLSQFSEVSLRDCFVRECYCLSGNVTVCQGMLLFVRDYYYFFVGDYCLYCLSGSTALSGNVTVCQGLVFVRD